MLTVFSLNSTAKNTGFLCDNRPLHFKIFFGQRETRAQRTNVKSHCGGRVSSPTLPQCQLGDCQVHLASQARLGVLGSLHVDIGLKLHSVHFAVKFSSASASENLTAKCTSCSFNSSPAKSNFKSASSRCARLGRLENGLSRT